ncbi:hypothetical protein OCU04_006828 [Sclerotinia nivalis]|uniref:Uncharacterized protein n=1 Tax=Sclerotinia nivalis TaxID=352851 RepID=A0A9X0AKN7_9HELO|nr:hypothetical protein OCU04_006828 [Sclerotinia nivalis]
MMFKYWSDQGFSLDTTGDVEKALQGLPVEDVHVTDHSDACFRRPEINDVVVVAIACEVTNHRNAVI